MAKTSVGSALKNALLSRLSSDVLCKLAPQRFDFEVSKVLYEPNEPIEYVYFPETAGLSIISLLENGSSIEVASVGREGMIGSMLLLLTNTTPYRHFVQIAGYGYRVGASRFCEAAHWSDELRDVVLRYEASFRTQTMQGTACNGMHSVEQRCCRWLLMTRDRVDSDELRLTHEFLGLMLGVRRSSVSDVLGPLQAQGLITSSRGTIAILDEKGLEERVCECYRIIADREYA